MKDAIGIWWDNESKDTSLELDINVWISKRKDAYIEFGLRIINSKNINNVYIFLPFLIEKDDIRDMVPDFKDSDTANALFNEKMSVVTDNSSLYEVTYVGGNKSPFYASCTNVKKRDIVESEGGCIVTIEIPRANSFSDVLYKRIRVKKIKYILNEYSENNFIIDGWFKKLKTVEISINTTRKLPQIIVDKLINKIKLTSINVFIMTNIFTNLTFMSQDTKSSRILEEDIWNEYLGINEADGKSIKKVIAYQWKKKEETIQDYNLFTKYSLIQKRWLVFLLSIGIIILFGAISGYAGNKLTDYLDQCCIKSVQDVNGSLIKVESDDTNDS